jgi:uncharacterized protein YkwD
VPQSGHAGRHRRRTPGPSGIPAVLTLLITLALLLASGVAVSLTAAPARPGPATRTGAAIGTAPAVTRFPAPSPAPDRTATPAWTAPPAPGAVARPPATRSSRAERSQPEPPAAGDSITAQEDRVVDLTNAERTAARCDELTVDERLRTAARGHSEDMAANDYFDHDSLDGRSPTDRARAAGYPGGVGENIAAGYRTPEEVVAGWMDSDGHRRNILDCDYTVIGVGLAYDSGGRPYWTQNFGSR